MKNILRTFVSIGLLLCSMSVSAQNCEIPVGVVLDNQVAAKLGSEASRILVNQLRRSAVQSGLNGDMDYVQFFVTAKVDVLDKEIVAGPPAKFVQQVGISIYIADGHTQTTFASGYAELTGVGNSESKCIIDALKRLNGQNTKVRAVLDEGKAKIVDYYNSHSADILGQARRLAATQEYGKALSLCVSIPVCAKDGDKATAYGMEIYSRNRDNINVRLLNMARTAWMAGQDADAAALAGQYLAAIDPEATCYDDALSLYNEIKGQLRKDIDFCMREKYREETKLESQRIEAMRAVGIAFGNGQKPTTTNLNWLR